MPPGVRCCRAGKEGECAAERVNVLNQIMRLDWYGQDGVSRSIALIKGEIGASGLCEIFPNVALVFYFRGGMDCLVI